MSTKKKKAATAKGAAAETTKAATVKEAPPPPKVTAEFLRERAQAIDSMVIEGLGEVHFRRPSAARGRAVARNSENIEAAEKEMEAIVRDHVVDPATGKLLFDGAEAFEYVTNADLEKIAFGMLKSLHHADDGRSGAAGN